MKKIELSIIVPVYNVETYLCQCVDSILDQKINNCEIILVDDGSTDDSGKLCDNYANEYENIKVFHQKNKGLSEARNTGIRNSHGEYLMFVDSDDFISDKIDLNEIIKNFNTDVIQYKWVYFYGSSNKYVYFKDHIVYEGTIPEILYKKILDGSFSVSACDKIIRRKVIVDNNLYFKEGIYSEDLDWSLKLYFYVNSIKDINEDIYIYRQQRIGSITNKCGNKNIVDLYNIIYYWYNYDYSDDIYKVAYLNYLAYHYVILLTILNKNNCDTTLRKKIYALSSILNYSQIKKVKLCKILFRIVGKKIGVFVLKMYIFLKDKGLIKL